MERIRTMYEEREKEQITKERKEKKISRNEALVS